MTTLVKYFDTVPKVVLAAGMDVLSPDTSISVSVTSNGTPISLFDDNGSAIANPVPVDLTGFYQFRVAPGTYDIAFIRGSTTLRTVLGVTIGGTQPIGLATGVAGASLATGPVAGTNTFRTDGYATAGDGGGALYYRNTGSAQPGDLISADGVRLSLSLSQQLTFEMLGAPTTGWIGTASISGNTLTVASTQSGALATGMTLVEVGGGTNVSAGTVITGGSGTSWTVNNSQSVTSRVMVANDSYPYLAAALQLGVYGIKSTGPHWFSKTPVIQGHPVRWIGASGYGGGGSNSFRTTWYVPSEYSALVAVPDNATVSASGLVGLTGTVPYGGASGWSVENIFFQVGDHSYPSAPPTNARDGIGVYTPGKVTNFQIFGASGNGLTVFGNAPSSIADKCSFTDFTIANCYGNGIESSGGDGNTCVFSNGVIGPVGASGIYEHSFLANTYYNIQIQTVGGRSVVRKSNNLYYSLVDGNVGNDPLSSPSQWQLWKASVGPDVYNPAFVSPVGCAIRTSGGGNVSSFIDCYTEGDCPPSLFQAASGGLWLTAVFGGQHAAGIDRTNGGCAQYGPVSYAAEYHTTGAAGAFIATGQNAGNYVGTIVNNTGVSGTAGAATDFQLMGVSYANFGGRANGTDKEAYIAVGGNYFLHATGGATQAFYPDSDNALRLGTPSKRWSDVQSVKINGTLPGIATKGDVAATLTVGTDPSTQLWNTPLTAARAVTLSTTGAVNGSKFRVVRTAAATGAFNLNVGTGPLKALTTAGAWADVEYDGSAWQLAASGSL